MIDETKSFTAKEFEPNDNLFGCLSPSYIYNKNTGHYETVPCHNCTYCVNVEASKQSRRVREEIKQHLFSVMFTLTYDNEFIPRMEAFAGKHGEMQLKPIGRTADLHDSCPFNSKNYNGDYRFNDDTRIPWIENNKIYCKNNLQFATVSKKDIQNFLKRLRKKIDKLNIPQNEKKIRYFIASEYGPKTYRPHYHGVLFIDSPTVLSKIKAFIVESWGLWVKKKDTFNKYEFKPFADTFLTSEHINICDPNTAYYVAEYVAGNLGLPKVLRERCTKPFHLQSKNPIIGEFQNSKEEVFARIDIGMLRKPTTFTKKDGTQKTVNLLISKDTLSTVFRKCYRYSNLSNDLIILDLIELICLVILEYTVKILSGIGALISKLMSIFNLKWITTRIGIVAKSVMTALKTLTLGDIVIFLTLLLCISLCLTAIFIYMNRISCLTSIIRLIT